MLVALLSGPLPSLFMNSGPRFQNGFASRGPIFAIENIYIGKTIKRIMLYQSLNILYIATLRNSGPKWDCGGGCWVRKRKMFEIVPLQSH